MVGIELYAGVDIGSTSVRIGIFDEEGTLKQVHETPITYHIDVKNKSFITQSSDQIWESFRNSFKHLQFQLKPDEEIVSIGCCATCSLVVMIEEDNIIKPYPINMNQDQIDQNVIFWMDSRAHDESEYINSTLNKQSELFPKSGQVLKYFGGSIIPEMALPKAMYVLYNQVKIEDRSKIRFFDLHDFITFKLLDLENNNQSFPKIIEPSNDKIKVGIDGTLKGWIYKTLNEIKMQELTFENTLPKIYHTMDNKEYIPIALAGSKLGSYGSKITVSQGVIDSYGSWYSSCGESPKETLVMVSGTSTCFITSHENPLGVIPGLWGPYQGIIKEGFVSAGGISLTGKLYERLFELHPAMKELMDNCGDIFNKIEQQIQIIEKKEGKNFQFLSKNMHYYGDLSGNRTPFCDPLMKGVLFGETLDNSILDLLKRYICIMEYLVFQTKIIVDLLKTNSIKIEKIVVSGSQGNNTRFIQLLANFLNLPVFVNKYDPGQAGLKGSFYLAFAAHNNLIIDDVIKKFNKFNNNMISFSPSAENYPDDLERILKVKFKIMQDIIQNQIKYRKMIDDI